MVRPEDVEGYKRMVAAHALLAWRYLPPQVRASTDVDDLIQDGLMFARFGLAPKWRPEWGKFTTLLHASLPHFYMNKMAVNGRPRKAQRIPLGAVSVEDIWIDLCPFLHEQPVDNAMLDHVVQAFERIYYESSLDLRESLRRWFLQAGEKVHVRGMRFERNRQEFLKLARRYNVDKTDCQILMASGRCQGRLVGLLPELQFVPVMI